MRKTIFLFFLLYLPAFGFSLHNLMILVGDFNDDGLLNAQDIDLLCSNFGSSDVSFDLNGDGQVGLEDRDTWLNVAGNHNLPCTASYLIGDVNFDGVVNTIDSIAVIANLGTSTTAYSQGDINGDGMITSIDLLLLTVNLNLVSCDMTNCASLDLNISDSHLSSGIIPNEVSISGDITISGTIASQASFVFTTRDGVLLLPDFEIQTGAQFTTASGCP